MHVTVFGQDNLSRLYTVDGSGCVSLALVGPVRARSHFELAASITNQLKGTYIKDPKVTVEVESYRPFFILGEVRKPGQFQFVNGGMPVETAVAIAEGYTERANERIVTPDTKFGAVMGTVMVPGLSGAARRYYLRARALLLKLVGSPPSCRTWSP